MTKLEITQKNTNRLTFKDLAIHDYFTIDNDTTIYRKTKKVRVEGSVYDFATAVTAFEHGKFYFPNVFFKDECYVNLIEHIEVIVTY